MLDSSLFFRLGKRVCVLLELVRDKVTEADMAPVGLPSPMFASPSGNAICLDAGVAGTLGLGVMTCSVASCRNEGGADDEPSCVFCLLRAAKAGLFLLSRADSDIAGLLARLPTSAPFDWLVTTELASSPLPARSSSDWALASELCVSSCAELLFDVSLPMRSALSATRGVIPGPAIDPPT